MSDLQALVDALAAEICRPVGVDDRRFHALAYSSHIDDVDDVRRASILRREAPKAVTAWLQSLGIADAASPIRVPANRDFGMAARLCVPVRLQASLLGYLWLIDEPEPVSDAHQQAALRCAAEVAAELYKTRRLESKEREREAELARSLLLGSDDAADVAALVQAELLAPASCYVVVVVRLMHREHRPQQEVLRVRLAAALEQVRRSVPPRQSLMLATGDHAIAVLALDEAAARSRAETLLTAADDQFTGEPGWSAIIGVGGARALLTEIRDSYREARAAVRVGTCLPDLGRIIAWSRLGAYRTITMLVGASDPAPMLPEGLLRLLVAHDAPMLVGTLEAYLEHAGDARAAAAAECVHRSTLYHRLRRIEEIAGVELRVGDDRLEMHLAVRLWRLAGSPGPDKLARSHDAASPRPDVRRSQTTDPRRWLPDASGTS